MSRFATFEHACADPDALGRASERNVVGYLSNTVPVELIRAAGFFAQQVAGSPGDETPDALRLMEGFMDGWALSVFQRAIDGRLAHLAALVVPRTSEVHLQLYYHLLEYRRQEPKAPVPEPILFDLLQTPFATTARYNASRLERLRNRLGEMAGTTMTDDTISTAIVEADGVRAALAQANALRIADPPRLSGAAMLGIARASTLMAPGDFIAAVDRLLEDAEVLPVRKGSRVLLTGSPHDDPGFHALVEKEGATIVADDHAAGDWWFSGRVGEGGSMAAILRHYHLEAPSPRTFPRESGDTRLMQAVARASPDVSIFFTAEWDDTLGFDYPTQRALLTARGVPCLFLKEQSYRIPDRAAQRAAVRRLIEGLPREAVA